MPTYYIPEHPEYAVYSDGVIMGPDPRGSFEPVPCPMFWHVQRERMMVILEVPQQDGTRLPLPFDAAEMLARGWGAPRGYQPGFYDGNPRNLKRQNLIMPNAMPGANGHAAPPVVKHDLTTPPPAANDRKDGEDQDGGEDADSLSLAEAIAAEVLTQRGRHYYHEGVCVASCRADAIQWLQELRDDVGKVVTHDLH